MTQKYARASARIRLALKPEHHARLLPEFVHADANPALVQALEQLGQERAARAEDRAAFHHLAALLEGERASRMRLEASMADLRTHLADERAQAATERAELQALLRQALTSALPALTPVSQIAGPTHAG